MKYEAQRGQPGVTAPAVCELVGLAHGLSPNSKPKQKTVRNFVRDGRAGKSPGKKGPEPKWRPEVVHAAIHAGSISQTRGGKPTAIRMAQQIKAATVGTKDDAVSKVSPSWWLRRHKGRAWRGRPLQRAGVRQWRRCASKKGGRGCRGTGGKAPVRPLR